MCTKTTGCNFALLLVVTCGTMLLALGSLAADEPQDQQDRISSFNVNTGTPFVRSAWPYPVRPPAVMPGQPVKLSIGAALSPNVGIGPGVSVDLTWDDAQWTVGQGRQIVQWYNDQPWNAEVSVHFAYLDMPDTVAGRPFTMTGYNMYDAVPSTNNWPYGQNSGCELQGDDTIGFASSASIDMLGGGRVVIGAQAQHWRNRANGTRLYDNIIYYQGEPFDCFYDPRAPLNVTWIDSTVYRSRFLDRSWGTYSRDPQVVTQWDGANTTVHLLLGEDSPGTTLTGPDYCDVTPYYTYTHFRKVGDYYTGTWSAGQIIDSLWFPWASLAAAPYPYTQLAVTYTNPAYYAGLLENPYDLDVWCRESFDRGVTWQPSYDITNYTNGIENGPDMHTAWLETQAFYDTQGDLHVIWTAKPTSSNPYFDGYEWQGFDQNLYHFEKGDRTQIPPQGTDPWGDVVKVANGDFRGSNLFSGSMDDKVCGFGGSNAGYIANIYISQCNDKLYCVWNQIHERANRFPWRDASPQPAPGVLDDCAYTDEPMARANWEIMMSVARVSSSSLWDFPRNISNTYTPSCGLQDDPDPDNMMRCGSEYKPSVEKYALQEDGLSLHWPSNAIVDLSPAHNYSGNFYLNMQYLDDQFPGPSMWGEWRTQPGTENSIKWIRLACVEPIEASVIAVVPDRLEWPQWVPFGQSTNFTITVVNEGNVVLKVTNISVSAGYPWLTVSAHPTVGSPLEVQAGVHNTATFDATISGAGLSTTQWLDGDITLQSDGANDNGYGVGVAKVMIHILAADAVEDPFWDTVQSHEWMFDPFMSTEGECVALAVSNFGEIGGLGGTIGATVREYGYSDFDGRVNLDYKESELECGTRDEDAVYLYSGSPFAIRATSSDGTGAKLTCSYNDRDQTDVTGWDPIGTKGSMTGGVSPNGRYDSVYTGRFVNRDTSIAMERIFYSPRSTHPSNDIINFVVCYTKFYSGDGQSHNHVTVGNVIDWNVPSDSVSINTSGSSYSGAFVYIRGTDTSGSVSCQPNTNRFATEAFGGGYTSVEWLANHCANSLTFHSNNALIQTIMVDTTNYRDGTPLTPIQPNPLVWWNATRTSGLNGDATVQDQAIFLTYKHDITLAATDTLHYWTVFSTVRNGTLAKLEAQVAFAKSWYTDTVRTCGAPPYPYGTGCWAIGDVDGSGGSQPYPYPDDVDGTDLDLLGQALGQTGLVLTKPSQGDLVADGVLDTLDLAAMSCILYGEHNPGGCLLPAYPMQTKCTTYVRLFRQPLAPLGAAVIVENPQGSNSYRVSGVGNSGNDGVRLYRDDLKTDRSVGFEADSLRLGVASASMTVSLRGTTANGPVPRTLGSVWLRNTTTTRFEIGADYWSLGSNQVVLAAYYEGVLTGIDTITRGVVAIGESIFGMPQISGMMLHSTNPPSVCVDLSVAVRLISQGTPPGEWFANRFTLTALNPTMTVTGFTPSDLKVARIPAFRIMNFGSDDQSYSTGTAAGSGVSVPFGQAADLVFETVTAGGTTELVVTTAGPQAPPGFNAMPPDQPAYYTVSTTASFTGGIDVCVHYEDAWLTSEQEQALVLLQYVNGQWVDITQSVLTATDVICGHTTSLSTFVVGLGWTSCCVGRVGDANGLGTYPNEVTISDIQTLVTAKFIQGTCVGYVSCIAEGDVNQSGGADPTCNDITISDIQTLVNHLFIAGPVNAPLKSCL